MKKKIIIGTIISLIVLLFTPYISALDNTKILRAEENTKIDNFNNIKNEILFEKPEIVVNPENNGIADDFYYKFYRPILNGFPLCSVAVKAHNWDGLHYGKIIYYECYLKIKIPGVCIIANVSQNGEFPCAPINNRDLFTIYGPEYIEYFKKGHFWGPIDTEFNIHILNDDSHYKVKTRGFILLLWTFFLG